MTDITADSISQALHAAVAEKGEDYIYQTPKDVVVGCVYYDPESDGPSCIVGHVVAALDPVAFGRMANFETDYEHSFSAYALLHGSETTPAIPIWDVDIDERAKQALNLAQQMQDLKRPWRYAQEAYDRVMAGETIGNILDDISKRWHAEKSFAIKAAF